MSRVLVAQLCTGCCGQGAGRCRVHASMHHRSGRDDRRITHACRGCEGTDTGLLDIAMRASRRGDVIVFADGGVNRSVVEALHDAVVYSNGAYVGARCDRCRDGAAHRRAQETGTTTGASLPIACRRGILERDHALAHCEGLPLHTLDMLLSHTRRQVDCLGCADLGRTRGDRTVWSTARQRSPFDALARREPDIVAMRDERLPVYLVGAVSTGFEQGVREWFRVGSVLRCDDLDVVCGDRTNVVAVTDGDKEQLDNEFRRRAFVARSVLVEFTTATSQTSLRWVAGRDWLLPTHPNGGALI